MIRLLVEGHDTVARTARQVFRVAESAYDQPIQEDTAWMLRSLLE